MSGESSAPTEPACQPVPSESEDEPEGFVHGPELAGLEASRGRSEPLWIEDSGLLDEYTCLLTLEGDRRTEARRPSALGGGGDEHGAEVEELVRLNDHREASTALFVPARPSRRREAEDLTANHVSGAAERARRAAPG
jgi:hypothetical protein